MKKRAPMVERMRQRLDDNKNVNLKDFNIPTDNGLETPRLKDILETKVDEKYYLKNDVVEKIVSESKFQERLVSLKLTKSLEKLDDESNF